MEICINYEERLNRLKKKYSTDQTEDMSCLHNMSVVDFRRAFVEHILRIKVELAGRKVLKIPGGKYDAMEGRYVIDYTAPTIYASIVKEDETGLHLSIADESKLFSLDMLYTIGYVRNNKTDEISRFSFDVKLYYIKA